MANSSIDVLEADLRALRQLFDERDRRYDERFSAMDAKTGLALTASKEAVLKAEIATEKRFDGVNEFRQTLADQQRTLMPRAEAEAVSKALETRLTAMAQAMTEKYETVQKAQVVSQGIRSGVQFGWQYSIAIIGLILTVIGIMSWFFGKPH